MNKKILIASLFAALMLLVPMTSVVGVTDISLNRKIEKIEDNDTITGTYDNEDCGCQVVSNQHLVRLERLLNRVKIYTNVISILSKHNSEITEKYEELSNKIATLAEMNGVIKFYLSFDYRPFLCAMVLALFGVLMSLCMFFTVLYNVYGGDFLFNIKQEICELSFYFQDLITVYCG